MDNDSKAAFPHFEGLLSVRHGADSELVKNSHTFSKESGGKVQGNVLLTAMTQKASC